MKTITLVKTNERWNGKTPEATEDYMVGNDGYLYEVRALKSTQGLELMNANGDINSNATGYNYAMTSLTYVKKLVSTQSFFTIAPADYMPVGVGNGAFSQSILTTMQFSNAGDFESGNVRSGESNSMLAGADASMATKTQAVINWGMQIGWTIFDVQQALLTNNWDPVYAKEVARRTIWDLGIQKIAFLGSKNNTGVTGLLNNANATVDTSTITQTIASMNATQITTFVGALVANYRADVNYSSWPTTFVVPEDDWNGLTTMVPGTVGTFPVSRITYLKQAFGDLVPGKFEIKPCAYGIPAMNPLGLHLYAIYNKKEESMKMEIPVDYTPLATNSMNGFQFQNAAIGQYTGLGLFKNLEMVYLRF